MATTYTTSDNSRTFRSPTAVYWLIGAALLIAVIAFVSWQNNRSITSTVPTQAPAPVESIDRSGAIDSNGTTTEMNTVPDANSGTDTGTGTGSTTTTTDQQ